MCVIHNYLDNLSSYTSERCLIFYLLFVVVVVAVVVVGEGSGGGICAWYIRSILAGGVLVKLLAKQCHFDHVPPKKEEC